MFARLFKRFTRDERGAFAVIFGMIAIVLTAMAGAVVDLVTVDQTRNRVQIALDSAALALQPDIYSKDNDYLMSTALKLVEERVSDPSVTVEMTTSDVSTDVDNGRLYLRAHVTVPMAFIALLGINEMQTSVVSQVTRKNLNIEVAMVLDNSGSMAGTKIANLKTAAKCAVNILFYGSCTPDAGATKDAHTKIGIVPFTFFVNVGTGYANATWMDRTGSSPLALDNFDTDDNSSTSFVGPLDRIDLMDNMTSQSWKGCIETRIYPYNVTDATPNTFDPATLFVPEFAPDEPDTGGYPNNYLNDYGGNCPPQPTWVHTQVKYSCNQEVGTWYPEYYYNNAYCTGGVTNSYVMTYPDGTTSTTVTSAPASVDAYSSPDVTTTYSSVSVRRRAYDNTRTITYKYNLPERERQERACKYNGGSASYWSWSSGPNANCPDANIQPLTDNPTGIATEIDGMVAQGGTNIHAGAAWGFRTLSPTEPFTEGRPYGTATSKVMIIMTDGENTYYPLNNMNGTQYYMPYGYMWNNLAHLPEGRLGTTDHDTSWNMTTKMNALTLETCTNAKAAGITIYTIGLQSPNTTTTNMLKSCASDTGKAYFPTDPAQLNSVFTTIAEQLAQLRIEK